MRNMKRPEMRFVEEQFKRFKGQILICKETSYANCLDCYDIEKYHYDNYDNLIYIEQTNENKDYKRTISFTYINGFKVKEIVEVSDGSSKRIVMRKLYVYKCCSNACHVIVDTYSSQFNRHDIDKYFYDGDGNILKIKYANNTIIKFNYRDDGKISDYKILYDEYDEKPNFTNFIYNEKGDIIREEDNQGFWVKYSYNNKGYLISENNSLNYIIKYDYNEKGNLIKSSDEHGNITRYIYRS